MATPLELLTDLCFVVAVSQASASFHHAVSAGHAPTGLLGFVFAFFAIWWCWLNFTWFASAYDNDDLIYRLLTIGQIVGSLVLAVGVPHLLEDNRVPVLGYVIMRVSLVLQWLRAARHDVERRRTCLTYAIEIAIVQSLWVGQLFVPPSWRLATFVLLILLEFSVPVLAERSGLTPWHPHHVAERYSLFFLIVLGETVLSTADAIQTGLSAPEAEFRDLITVVAGGIGIVFSVWWLYFSRPAAVVLSRHRDQRGSRQGFVWGYGHYLILASAAAIGAGLAARIDFRLHEGEATAFGSAITLTGSVAVLLAAIWLLQLRPHDGSARTVVPFGLAVLAVLAATFSPYPEVLSGIVCAVLLAVEIRVARLNPGPSEAE